MMAQNGQRDETLDLLLPWYVNGTLDAEEQRQVEAYLERSAQARDEVELLRQLRQQVKDEQIENSPAELGLQRLKREIRQADQPDTSTKKTGKVVTVASWWRPLAVAACIAVVIQAAVLIGLTRGPGSEVTIAGGTSALSAPVIQVTFAPTATEQNIRDVLQSAGAGIADGPSALGVYELRLLDPSHTTVDQALTALKARGDVVTFAERK